MRTKVLLGLAALAASAVGASAQNVYSLNVVGYINIPLVEGFNAIGNQLDYDGTGNNNTVNTVFSSNLPPNSVVYAWTGTGWNSSSTFSSKTKAWSFNMQMNPGQGFLVDIPVGSYGGASSNVTTVGTVLQGSLVNTNIPAAGGFWAVSSKVPLSGTLQANCGYIPEANDKVYEYSPGVAGGWNTSYTYSGKTHAWASQDPPIAIGQAIFLDAAGPAAGWTQNFTVQ